jgi:hypothetical protein
MLVTAAVLTLLIFLVLASASYGQGAKIRPPLFDQRSLGPKVRRMLDG